MQDIIVSYSTFSNIFGVVPTYYQQLNSGAFTLWALKNDIFITSYVTDASDITDFTTNFQSNSIVVAGGADDARLLGTIANTVSFNANATISSTWTNFKSTVISKALSIQYNDNGSAYTIFAFDDSSVIYTCTIWKGTVPAGVISGGYSQAQNDSDKSNFETNYKPYANMPVDKGIFTDPRLLRRFGNISTTSTSEILVSLRPYTEQGSDAQRAVQSSSVQDKSTGTGAAAVRITYLNSNYVLKTEDVVLNGTTKVNTVGTDIRFVERFEVIQGNVAAGSISLLNGTGGGATEFCGISSATTEAFLCHHYVPAGKRAWVLNWGATADDEVNLKLNGQLTFGTNTVPSILGLENLRDNNPTSLSTVEFTRDLTAVQIPEKTRIYVTVVPNQTTATTTRAWFVLFEDVK